VAFELRGAAHVIASCEVLAANRIMTIWGPLRHGPSHNMATYHRNPDNLVMELFSELDRMSDEGLGYFDPKPWHRARPQRPRVWPKDEHCDIWDPSMPHRSL
jgi:hypothetical protein